MWTLEAHLLAMGVDVGNVGNWQRAGRKGAPKPKPIPRPGARQAAKKKTLGRSTLSIEEMAEKQAAWAAGVDDGEVAVDGS
jgi:hypothetical protein